MNGDKKKIKLKASAIDPDSITVESRPEDLFDKFSEAMRLKFNEALKKPGNVEKPWIEFNKIHLENGFNSHVVKYLETGEKDQLIDLANYCLFLYYNTEEI